MVKELSYLIQQGDLLTHSVQLEGCLHGFVYQSRKGKMHMFINDSLSPDALNDAILHEGGHIFKHLNQSDCMVGINNTNKKIEKEANAFEREKLNLHQQLAEP